MAPEDMEAMRDIAFTDSMCQMATGLPLGAGTAYCA